MLLLKFAVAMHVAILVLAEQPIPLDIFITNVAGSDGPAAVYGSLDSVEGAPLTLPSRAGAVAFKNEFDEGGYEVFLFGGWNAGWDEPSENFNDLWLMRPNGGPFAPPHVTKLYDPFEKDGVYVAVGSHGWPSARSFPVVWTHGDLAYLFGGMQCSSTGYNSNSDLWEYNMTAKGEMRLLRGNSGDEEPDYGSFGSFSSAATPGFRTGMATWPAPEGNGDQILFGGGGYFSNVFNDVWYYSKSLNEFAHVGGSNSENDAGYSDGIGREGLPKARTGMVYWSVSATKGMLFGGATSLYGTSGDFYNDLWEVDLVNFTFTWLHGSLAEDAHGVYGTKSVEAAGNFPGARMFARLLTVVGDEATFAGGFGCANTECLGVLSDVWRYNRSSNAFTWVSGPREFELPTNGPVPDYNDTNVAIRGIWDSTSWQVSTTGFVFGGAVGHVLDRIYGMRGVVNTIAAFDSTDSTMRLISGTIIPDLGSQHSTMSGGTSTQKPWPGGRSLMSVVEHAGSTVTFLGGYGFADDDYGSLNDMWSCDYLAGDCIWRGGSRFILDSSVHSGPSTRPGGRDGSAAFHFDGKFHTFGGSSSRSGLSADFWADLFSLNSDGSWNSVGGPTESNTEPTHGTLNDRSPSNWPGARAEATVWEGDNMILLFGGLGISPGGTGYLSDLWMFDGLMTWIGGPKERNEAGVYTNGTDAWPAGRSGALGWAVGDVWYIFGGIRVGGSLFADLWAYTVSTRDMRWVGGPATTGYIGSYGDLKDADPEVYRWPRAAYGAVGWVHKELLVMYGGSMCNNRGAGSHDDLWVYNTTNGVWSWVFGSAKSCTGAAPTGGADNPGSLAGSMTWTHAPGVFMLFGGAMEVDSDLRMRSETNSFFSITICRSHEFALPAYGGCSSCESLGRRQRAGASKDQCEECFSGYYGGSDIYSQCYPCSVCPGVTIHPCNETHDAICDDATNSTSTTAGGGATSTTDSTTSTEGTTANGLVVTEDASDSGGSSSVVVVVIIAVVVAICLSVLLAAAYAAGRAGKRTKHKRYFEDGDDRTAVVDTAAMGTFLKKEIAKSQPIAKGGFGAVYKIKLSSGQFVALKVLDPAASEVDKAAFHREANILTKLSALSSPFFVGIACFCNDPMSFGMEFADGGDLNERVLRSENFSMDDALRYCLATLEPLAVLHKAGYAHLDVKPQNFFCYSPGPNERIVLGDFGLSVPLKEGTGDTVLVGTAKYFAPERHEASRLPSMQLQVFLSEIDLAKCDVFSWAIMSSMFFNKEQPFKNTDVTTLPAMINDLDLRPGLPEDIPPWLISLLHTCWDKNPEERLSSMDALIRMKKNLDPDGTTVVAASKIAGLDSVPV